MISYYLCISNLKWRIIDSKGAIDMSEQKNKNQENNQNRNQEKNQNENKNEKKNSENNNIRFN